MRTAFSFPWVTPGELLHFAVAALGEVEEDEPGEEALVVNADETELEGGLPGLRHESDLAAIADLVGLAVTDGVLATALDLVGDAVDCGDLSALDGLDFGRETKHATRDILGDGSFRRASPPAPDEFGLGGHGAQQNGAERNSEFLHLTFPYWSC